MKIYDRIKKDHESARAVIKEIKATEAGDAGSRTLLFDHFKLDMWAHHKVEEAVFYSYLRSGEAMFSVAIEAINEHHMANGMIEELDTFPVDSEEWLVKFKAVCELIEHHMDEEEDEFFEKARKILDDATAEKMGAAFDERKAAMLEALTPLSIKKKAA